MKYIRVNEFQYEPGVNDIEYIELLEKVLDNEKRITSRALAKLKELTRATQPQKETEKTECKNCIHGKLMYSEMYPSGYVRCFLYGKDGRLSCIKSPDGYCDEGEVKTGKEE